MGNVDLVFMCHDLPASCLCSLVHGKAKQGKRRLGEPHISNRFGFFLMLNTVVEERPVCRQQEGRRTEKHCLTALGWLAS